MVLFLISGLAGLSRLEWLPIAYRHHGSQDIEKNNLSTVNEGIQGRPIVGSTGEEWTDEQLQKSKRDFITTKQDWIKINKLSKLNNQIYRVNRLLYLVLDKYKLI